MTSVTIIALAWLAVAPAEGARAPSRDKKPTPSSATTKPSPAESRELGPWWLSGSVGPGFPLSSEGPLWLRANVRMGWEPLRLDARTALQVALPLGIGWTRATGAFSSISTVYGFELLPQARLSYQLSERLRLHGELGLGIVHYRFGFEIPAWGSATGSSTGVGFRFGAGLEVRLTDRLAVLVDPSLLAQTASEGTFRFGNTTFSSNTGVGTQASVLLGVRYRL